MAQKTYVLGVGMVPFVKPRGLVDYPWMGQQAGAAALLDSGLSYSSVTHGLATYAYGDSTSGQRAFYTLGLTGIPIINLNNNCSTGSSGLWLARQLCSAPSSTSAVLVIGFEKMHPGSLQSFWKDRENPLAPSYKLMAQTVGLDPKAPGAPQLFGNAGREYMEKHGATREDFAEIARVNHEHSQRNPYSQFRDVYTREQILNSGVVWEPLTKLQCCPTSDGAAAAVVVGEAFLDKHPALRSRAVEIAGQSLVTDSETLFSGSAIDVVGYGMTAKAAAAAYREAGIKPEDVRLCELHDCFSTNEMVTLDGLGLCEKGKAHLMVRSGDITYGGRVVVNPSGGLISKGHPLGATGLAQCAELVWQLRGWAGARQVDGVKVALQHNLGLGGAAVVTVYRRADGGGARKGMEREAAKASGRGFNPAVEARAVTPEELEKVIDKRTAHKLVAPTPPKPAPQKPAATSKI